MVGSSLESRAPVSPLWLPSCCLALDPKVSGDVTGDIFLLPFTIAQRLGRVWNELRTKAGLSDPMTSPGSSS